LYGHTTIGDKTVAVLPAMNGGCYIDMNQFIILDGNAIRLVNTAIDIDLPTVSLYAGSYTDAAGNNNNKYKSIRTDQQTALPPASSHSECM
jgi:hypothetical protein